MNDVKDTLGRDQIRSHFRHIVQMFADGNFNAPMLVHGPDVPGTATMKRLKDQLHWQLENTPRGARDYGRNLHWMRSTTFSGPRSKTIRLGIVKVSDELAAKRRDNLVFMRRSLNCSTTLQPV